MNPNPERGLDDWGLDGTQDSAATGRCSIVFECTMNRWRDYFHFLCSTYLFVCVIVCLENVYPGSEESSSGSWAKIGRKKDGREEGMCLRY
jgi:hypothetical protein